MPVRHVMAPDWDVATAVLALAVVKTSRLGAAWKPNVVGFNKSRPDDIRPKTALLSEVA